MKKLFILTASVLFMISFYSQQLSFEIYYKENKFELSKESQEFIKSKFYETYGYDYVVNIEAYTDDKGKIAYNQRLSELRAQQTYEFIRCLGLNIEEIKYNGMGEFKPYDGPKEKENPAHRKSVVNVTYKISDKIEKTIKERLKNACADFKESDELMKALADLNKGIYRPAQKDTVVIQQKDTVTVVVQKVDTVVISRVDTVVVFDREKSKLEDVKVGEAIVFRNINFKPNKAIFLKSSFPELEELLNVMKFNSKLRIEIQGHVCCGRESDPQKMKDFNQQLSFDRAKAVSEYLEKNGINETRMKYVGKGFSEPLVKEELTVEDEINNRRVEIKVLEK